MAQIPGLLLPMRETCIESWAPAFGLAHQHLGSKLVNETDISFSLK